MTLQLCHLYGDIMNTYGDDGNIIAIQKRCAWRGIDVELMRSNIGDSIPSDVDLFFFGGGQDKAQEAVGRDLVETNKGAQLKKQVDDGTPLLSICGGYQLLAEYYQPFEGQKIPGVGLFPAYTEAGQRRMIGNVVVQLRPDVFDNIHSTIVGFENHSGRTFLRNLDDRLGTVVSGNGNNGGDSTEGIMVKHAIGCYLHGSLLPKNPHLADWLIGKALEHRYRKKIDLSPLDDTLEWRAHSAAGGT
ncbi:MAG: glutamine amidotransferase [bacterium]|nr:glutamine amidotransferase [bacterium]